MYLFSSIQTFRGAQEKERTILQDVSCRKIHPAARQTWNLNKERKVSPCKSNVWVFILFPSPHHCVGFLFFAWHPPHRFRVHPPPCPSPTSLITPHSSQHYSSHLTHHTTCQSHHAVTSQYNSSHHASLITALLITPLVNHTTLSCSRRSTQSVAGAVHRAFWRSQELLRAWSPAGPRLTFVWQAQYTGLLVPHITVWGSCFSLGTRRAASASASASARRRVPNSSHLTHHSTTHHTSLISALLITPHSSPHYSSHLTHHSTTHHTSLITALLITHHSSQHYSSHLTHHRTTHHTSLITALLTTPHSSQHYSSHLTHHSTTHHTSLITAPLLTPHSSQHYFSHRLSQPPHRGWLSGGAAACFLWHAQYIEPSGGAAARVVAGWLAASFRVAGVVHTGPAGGAAARAVHRAFCKSWCARGRRWPAAGCRVAGAVHRASWRSWCYRVAGAVHRASWRSCCHTTLSHHFVTHTHTPSFTHHLSHHFVTHHLSHAIFDTPSFTPHLSHTILDTPLFTHHLSHTTLSPTIFDTPSFPPALTHHLSHNFGTHHLSLHHLCHTSSFTAPSFAHIIFHTPSHAIFHTPSQTIFHTPLCHTPAFTQLFHTPSFTHHLSHTIFVTHHLSHTVTDHLSHTTLSHTIFDTPSFTQLCHTPSFTTPSLSHTIFHTQNFVTHHLSSTSSFVFPSFPVPATTFLAHYWKKLTCRVIRSFFSFLYGWPGDCNNV